MSKLFDVAIRPKAEGAFLVSRVVRETDWITALVDEDTPSSHEGFCWPLRCSPGSAGVAVNTTLRRRDEPGGALPGASVPQRDCAVEPELRARQTRILGSISYFGAIVVKVPFPKSGNRATPRTMTERSEVTSAVSSQSLWPVRAGMIK